MSGETPDNNSPPEAANEKQSKSPAYEDAFDSDKLLARIKQRYDDGVGAFEENRRLHSEDLNFVYNSESMGQWDPVVLEARKGKPCYTFNRVIQPVSLVIADMRQTRPAVKYRPSTDGAKEAVADVFGGLWRSCEQLSRSDLIYKTQYKFSVAGGFGAFYMMPEYAGDDTFDQIIKMHDIPNPQTVVWDPECNDPCAGDANWGMIGDRISSDKHETLYPGADLSSFSISRDSYGWFTDKEIRVVDYFERVPYEKTIALMSDGTTIDWTAEEKELETYKLERKLPGVPTMVRTRKVIKWRVMWVKCNGGQLLTQPIFYDWKRIPIIRIPGRYINIEGRKKLQSLVRFAKDAQRSYNSRQCDMIERAALTPKAPYLVTHTMIKGFESEWNQANTASRPYLPYNVDKAAVEAGGMPIRTPPIDVPTAALALSQAALADIQATTGYFDPALGNAEDMNRVSGKALVQHTRRSDLGSFEFIDGFGSALQLAAEIFADMVPTVLDTERVVRIVGIDDVEQMITVNGEQEGSDEVINDLKAGTYDCTVTIGPSYQTARQENLAMLLEAAEVIPAVNTMMPDLILKNLDTKDQDEMVRRARIPLIQQGIVKPTEEEQQPGAVPPPPQDPVKAMEAQRLQALTRRDSAAADIQQHKAQMIPFEDHERIIKAAGVHLANLVLAQKLGQDKAAFEAEQSLGGSGAKPESAGATPDT